MLNSSTRKIKLAAWLFTNNMPVFFSSLKMQKFFFFYEIFTYINDKKADFNYLKGYDKGPVFTDVYGDYTYRFDEFFGKIGQFLNSENVAPFLLNDSVSFVLDEKLAKKSSFLVSILNEDELSDLTHAFDIWKSAEAQIKNGEKQVPLSMNNFSEADHNMAKELCNLYSLDYIENSDIVSEGETNFVMSKADRELISKNNLGATLQEIALYEKENPVYISIEDGVIVVDS